MKTISTRDAFGEAISELGAINPEVVVLNADLMSATKTADFDKKFPDRSYNVGIAESNMINFAVGLATVGYIPFACTFAIFAAGRAFEQIRQSVCYPQINVKIVGTHGGITVGEDGATHQAIEDLTLMRVLPNMTILNPSDAIETRKAVMAMAEFSGPVYLRLGRSPVPIVTTEDTKFEIGKAIKLREGNDISLLATGMMTSIALETAQRLANLGIQAGVWNFHTIKPIDRKTVIEAAICGRIITLEEHSIIGGFGGAVDEVICQDCTPSKVKVLNIGIKDTFGSSGSADDLLEAHGLTVEQILKTALKVCSEGESE
jgi:transketolase